MMRSYSSDALVLFRKNYGEADRILNVYSRNYGKLKLLAKGVRKPKSKKRGHVEIFSRIKFSAVRGNGMDLITEAETIDSYESVRKDLKKATIAYYFCEVVDKMTRDDEKNEHLYDEFVNNLDELKNSEQLRSLRKLFTYKMLVSLGFWPANKKLDDVDRVLNQVVERQMSTVRVGKKILL